MSSQYHDLATGHVLTINEAKDLVDTHLLSLFHERAAQAQQLNVHYQTLWQAITTLYLSGGKRLRPYLTLLAYDAFGGNERNTIIPVAAAQELLHQAMLIHDDIIDRDSVRYGVKNITGQFNEIYASLLRDEGERQHFAESSALLAGDLLISEAHAHIATSGLSPAQIVATEQTLAASVFHVVGGELLDTEASFRGRDEIDPLTVAAQKTASYSFVSPLTMGAVLAGVDAHQIEILKDFGNSVGIAFQLRDDIIGVFGDEAVSGKSADGDLREGKRTLLIDEFYKRADEAQKARFEQSFGNQAATADDLRVLRELLDDTGTHAAIEAYITHYMAQTVEQLELFAIPEAYRSAFADVINYCLMREK
jgi:geranylgeranyl diphosphate synthase, type I